MSEPDPASLRAALAAVADPATGRDIVTAGLLEDLQVRGGLVQATLRTERARAREMEGVARAAEQVLGRQPGVTNATVVLTAHRAAAPAQPAPPAPAPHGPA